MNYDTNKDKSNENHVEQPFQFINVQKKIIRELGTLQTIQRIVTCFLIDAD